MDSIEFYDDAPWGDADRTWRETNRALNRLISLYLPKLDLSISTARNIRCKLEAIFPIMEKLCRRTCPWCPEPCCIVNKVWIDFQDLVFLHLTSQLIPPGQLTTTQYDTCRYLKSDGCLLPRNIRPWGCTQYVCRTQIKNLQKRNRMEMVKLEAEIRSIRTERLDMEESFVHTISRKCQS